MSNLESKYNVLATQTSKKIRRKCGFQAGMAVVLAVIAAYVVFGAAVPTIVTAFRTIAAAGAVELAEKSNALSGGVKFLLLVLTALYIGVLGVILLKTVQKTNRSSTWVWRPIPTCTFS